MDKGAQLNKGNQHRLLLEETGRRILDAVRTQLYLGMPFMGQALGSLGFVMDLSTTHVGTDAVNILFNPHYLMQTYLEFPFQLNRVYMHLLMHCLFRHMFAAEGCRDAELWDLCCDIAAESVVDSIESDAVARTVTDRRAEIYRELQEEVKVLTAPRLYRYFTSRPRDYVKEELLQKEFYMDDHSFWERLRETPPVPAPSSGRAGGEGGSREKPQENSGDRENPQENDGGRENPQGDGGNQESPRENSGEEKNAQEPAQIQKNPAEDLAYMSREQAEKLDKDWEKNARKVRAALEGEEKKAGKERGHLDRILRYELRQGADYRKWLSKFKVLREEAGIDMDSFDYGFYNFGMQMYGNMPLIEENEFREARKIEELVIAIDTSASCQDRLVREFLNDTATILLTGDHFFSRVCIHVILCDDQVQGDTLITDVEQMRRFADGFNLRGGYGTDFRPVFRYVEELQARGELKNLKGLLYFTDGYGIYPKKPTPYDTAFVFRSEDDFSDAEVPVWAAKLYL